MSPLHRATLLSLAAAHGARVATHSPVEAIGEAEGAGSAALGPLLEPVLDAERAEEPVGDVDPKDDS